MGCCQVKVTDNKYEVSLGFFFRIVILIEIKTLQVHSEQNNDGKEEIKYSSLNFEEEILTKKNENDTSHAKDFYDNPFNSPNHISLTTENESMLIKEWKNNE